MTLADVSPVVRDALAVRRYRLRRGFDPSHAFIRHTLAWCRVERPGFIAREVGLPAYIPDGPLPLPGGAL